MLTTWGEDAHIVRDRWKTQDKKWVSMKKQETFIQARSLTKKDLLRLYRAIMRGVATQAQNDLVSAPDIDRQMADEAYKQARMGFRALRGRTITL
jgi:hypothetical protein